MDVSVLWLVEPQLRGCVMVGFDHVLGLGGFTMRGFRPVLGKLWEVVTECLMAQGQAPHGPPGRGW